MSEIWTKSRTDAAYEISNDGRIRSLDRIVEHSRYERANSYTRFQKGRLLKPFISKTTGYLQVNLSKKARYNVHRLVAFEFCDGFQDGFVVNHINGNRLDNRATNLEWITQAGNNLHAFRCLNRVPSSLGKFGSKHPASKSVIGIDIKTGDQFVYESAMDAVREGFDSGGISNCCSGRMKTHKGRIWRKLENGDG